MKVLAPAGPLTRRGVSGVVKAACARAGVPPAGAHRLRQMRCSGRWCCGRSFFLGRSLGQWPLCPRRSGGVAEEVDLLLVWRSTRAWGAKSSHRDGSEITDMQRLDIPIEGIAACGPRRVDKTLHSSHELLHAGHRPLGPRGDPTAATGIQIGHGMRLAPKTD